MSNRTEFSGRNATIRTVPEFPRLPFYKDFWQWSNKGKELMDLHLNYETVEKYKLKRVDKAAPQKAQKAIFEDGTPEPMFKAKGKVKVKLKADKENGIIYIDEHTHLEGVPAIAWTYKLGTTPERLKLKNNGLRELPKG
jgi:predicted helicase